MFNPFREMMLKFSDWKNTLKDQKKNLFYSIGFLFVSMVVMYFAGNYAMKNGDSEVSDIILANIPAIDLNYIFVYLWIAIISLLIIYPLFFRVYDLSRTLFHMALLIFVRGCFIIMTHLKTPFDAIPVDAPWPLNLLFVNNDMFFSGHTALPLVGFFVFKDSPIRWLFLSFSVIMAATSLLMHRHYTIDVASAFFIAYGTFKLGEWILFKIQNRGKKKELRDNFY